MCLHMVLFANDVCKTPKQSMHTCTLSNCFYSIMLHIYYLCIIRYIHICMSMHVVFIYTRIYDCFPCQYCEQLLTYIPSICISVDHIIHPKFYKTGRVWRNGTNWEYCSEAKSHSMFSWCTLLQVSTVLQVVLR